MLVIYGLLAFGVLLALWVVLPHRLVHRHRAPASSAPQAKRRTAALRRLPRGMMRPTWRRHLVGMRITRPAKSDGNGAPAYLLVIDVSGKNGGSEARVPIHKEITRSADVLLKERYWTEIAGVRVEAGNLPAVEAMAREVIGWLLDGQRLPYYWLRAPHHLPVPVFVRDGRCVARVRGGPEIAAPSLAMVRAYLSAYLGDPVPHVMALSFADLRYHRAYAILEAPGVWIPVFQDRGALRVPDSETGGQPVPPAPDLLTVRRAAAEALARTNGGHAPVLRAVTCLGDDARTALLGQGAPVEHVLLMPDATGRRRMFIPIRRLGDELACEPDAVLPSGPQDGVRSVFFGPDLWSLADVVGTELERRGVVRRDEIGVQRAADVMGTVS